MQIQIAEHEEEIGRCFPVMVQLRPHLSEAQFIERVRLQQKEGYRLAYLVAEEQVKATAGFRLLTMLSRGKSCYVDDLVTDGNSRSQGFGDALFDWLVSWARGEGCERFHLDSGVTRYEAHRFYFRKRMALSAHHFSLPLE